MTFAEYLRARKSYTEGGIALRQALEKMPAKIQDAAEVDAWLQQSGASSLARRTAAELVKQYRERQRLKSVPSPVPRDRNPA